MAEGLCPKGEGVEKETEEEGEEEKKEEKKEKEAAEVDCCSVFHSEWKNDDHH